jgi:hypothetical protein
MPSQKNVFIIGNFKFDLFDNFKGLSTSHIAITILKGITADEDYDKFEMSPELLEYFG